MNFINQPSVGLRRATAHDPYGSYCTVWDAETGEMFTLVTAADAEGRWVDQHVRDARGKLSRGADGRPVTRRLQNRRIFIAIPERFANA